ncbi:MAG: co-chaperone DjlA [Spirochaetales bacterium]|nr:co-chaperone DjlA [Spirochaetales bacterium]
MFFIGPVLGGFLGLIIGGFIGLPFLGMIIGAFLGSSSRGAYNIHRRGTFFGNDFGGQSRASELFFESIFSMLGKLASVDGAISASEERVVREFMSGQLGLNPVSQQSAMEYFNKASRDNTHDFAYWAQQLYIHYRSRPAILELAYNLLLQVAAADGKISDKEKALLETAASTFRLNQGNSRSYGYYSGNYGYNGGSRGSSSGGQSGSRQSTGGTGGTALNAAYGSLGLTPNASDDEVKKVYRKKVAEFHPDKIAAKGLPEEFTKFATEKFQEIQSSYDVIKKARSF